MAPTMYRSEVLLGWCILFNWISKTKQAVQLCVFPAFTKHTHLTQVPSIDYADAIAQLMETGAMERMSVQKIMPCITRQLL